MNAADLLRRSLRFFWRTHLGVVLGAACATAVLVGALAVGDSVRLSLREQALQRIGRIDAVLAVRERFFRADLADRIAAGLEGAEVAPLLQLDGIATTTTGAAHAGIVDVFGVDERFFSLSLRGAGRTPPAAGQAFVNERLAAHLGVRAGDTIVLRVEQPSTLPRDMALATIDDVSSALRVEIGTVLSEDEFGRFSLRASQVPPFDVFVSLPWLQEQLELPERANVLAVSDENSGGDLVARADAALRSRWTLADAGLGVRELDGSELFELTSDRVFLDSPVVAAVTRIEPGLLGVLTYFVRELRANGRATPYSTVSAIGPLSPGATPLDPAIASALRVLPADMGEDDIVLNEWLAKDLQAKVGDTVELDYFVMGPQLRLDRESHAFRAHAVVPMRGLAADPELMPAFPGIEDSERCSDWEPGIPIELDRIRDVDEEYWDLFGGTPKAFVRLRAGQALWGNRFGTLTAVRGPKPLAPHLSEQLLRTLDPAEVGLFFQDLRGPALAGGTPATDFGGLYLGLSFFLIVAAMLLTSLLFVFGVEQRANEIGTLLALGFRPVQVRRLFLGEALILALVGGVLGAVLGLGYTHVVLLGLGTLWRDTVGATTLTFHARPETVALGTLIAILTAVTAIAIALRRTFHHPALELLASRNGIPSTARVRPRGRVPVSLALAIGSTLGAVAVVAFAGTSSEQAAGAFFGAGALLLIGALSGCRRLLTRFADAGQMVSVGALAIRNTGRRPGRSLATIALLASGTFLVVAVQANRLEPPSDATLRASGTGGFALFGRSTLPVLRDLATDDGRAAYGLESGELDGVDVVPMRVRDGDDASCLNLNLPQNPRLLGVRAAELADRGAFRFVSVLPPPSGLAPANPWLALDADYGDGVVPAIADHGSVTWALHKKLGDMLDYRDDRGRDIHVRIVGTLANSILQGNLLVSEQRFEERFPSASGHRMFLIDAPAADVEHVASRLTQALRDVGLEVATTSARLQTFNAVQNSYLAIFGALGALGLLLGSVGLGMVVLRNVLERRSELALLSAVGLRPRAIRWLVSYEHVVLLGLGLASGVGAALVAVLPGLGGAGDGLSLLPMLLLVTAVTVSGAAWVFVASVVATRGPLLDALSSE